MVPAKVWANAETVKRRARMLHPGAIEGTRVVPMPKVPKDEYRALIKGKAIAEKTNTAGVEDVALSELTATQQHVNTQRLIEHATNPMLIAPGTRASGTGGVIDVPTVVVTNGNKVLHDGHHRCVAAKLKGETTIKARVIRL